MVCIAMKTKIVTVHFDHPDKHAYRFLLGAFRESVYRNMPDSELSIVEIPPPQRDSKNARPWSDNTVKIREWLSALSMEYNLIFADCDMIITGDLSTAFENYDFDIAYTKRPQRSKHPLNGGIVFVRSSEKAHDFIKLWTVTNEKMYRDKQFHKSYQPKYGGINQSALGHLLETGDYDANVIDLPCEIWNACDESWNRLRDDVKAIHYKGALRNDVISRAQIRFPKAIEIWDEYNAISHMAAVVHKDNINDRKNTTPVTFTEKLFFRRLYDRNPLLADLANIHISRERAAQYTGEKNLIPLLADIPGGNAEYIVRMNGIGKLNMYITEKRRLPRMNVRMAIKKWLAMNIGFENWGESQIMKKEIYIERLIRNSDGSLPDTIAVDVFDGKPEFISVSQFTLQAKPILKEKKVFTIDEIDSEPMQTAAKLATKMCANLDYMRVEFLDIDDMAIFHRFAPYPDIREIDGKLDLQMGEKWFLTNNVESLNL
jgi:hypothetical protein